MKVYLNIIVDQLQIDKIIKKSPFAKLNLQEQKFLYEKRVQLTQIPQILPKLFYSIMNRENFNNYEKEIENLLRVFKL